MSFVFHTLTWWLVALATLFMPGISLAALDADATTSDHSINEPVAWWTFESLTPIELQHQMSTLKARPVGLSVTGSDGPLPRFMVRLVANQGAYAVPGASFVWDRTEAQIIAMTVARSSRIIALRRYGNERFVALTVPNSGATARVWNVLLGRQPAELESYVRAHNLRIIDLQSYVATGGSLRVDAVVVPNRGSDEKAWDWAVDQTQQQMDARVASFGGRLVSLQHQLNGLYTFVQVHNGGKNHSAWWRGLYFTSLQEVNQYAAQFAARPLDVRRESPFLGLYYFHAVFIDNANAATRAVRREAQRTFVDADGQPIGIVSSYVKRLDTDQVLVSFNARRRAETASSLKALHLLHAMQQVNAGDPLGSDFTYFNYPTDKPDPADACPDPAYEGGATYHITLEQGLDLMMNASDNRTTRGVVRRYGGFDPFNATARAAGMHDTALRHNIGCAYRDLVDGGYAPWKMRNETTAADLASLWAGVKQGRLLPAGSLGQREFMESANPVVGAGEALQSLIAEEAVAMGLSPVDMLTFGARVRLWNKKGSYGTCLGLADDRTQCGQRVVIRATAGLLALPVGQGPTAPLRYHAFATLMADVPVPASDSPEAARAVDAWRAVYVESLRSAVRLALQQWR